MNKEKMWKITSFALAILWIISSAFLAFAPVEPLWGPRNGGGGSTTVDIAIYADPDCTAKLTSINWGTMYPGQTKGFITYIKSVSTIAIRIYFYTDNFVPIEVAGYLDLTWNYDNTNFYPGEIKRVIFYLTVHPDVTGITNFSFDIHVVGFGSGTDTENISSKGKIA